MGRPGRPRRALCRGHQGGSAGPGGDRLQRGPGPPRAPCLHASCGDCRLGGFGVQHGGPQGALSGLPLPQGPSRNLLLNGKSYPTKVRLIRGGSLPPVKRRRMNWIDAPDDVFYMATEETRWGPL